MTLITKTLTEQLLANGRAQRAAMDKGEEALDFKPVVKLFTPDAQCYAYVAVMRSYEGCPSIPARFSASRRYRRELSTVHNFSRNWSRFGGARY